MRLKLWHWISMVWILSLSQAFGSSFSKGPFDVSMTSLRKGDQKSPTPALVFAPQGINQDAPVLYFNHGFLLANKYYEDLLSHISSYGYVVVAPQNYTPGGLPIGKPSKVAEAESASKTLQWIMDDLPQILDIPLAETNIGLIGHSRGGAVSYILARDSFIPQALATIDPVDGDRDGSPRVIQGPFSFDIPTLIVGTGLGGVSQGLGGACAPKADNHEKFFTNSPSPSFHITVSDYGHMDMLDPGTSCGFICNSCAKAASSFSRELLIEQLAGSLVSFFDASLKGNSKSYEGVLKSHEGMNIETNRK